MDVKESSDEKFIRTCGEIIREGIQLESGVSWFIAEYFTFDDGRKYIPLNDLVLDEIAMGRKIEILDEICKRLSVDEKIRKSLVGELKVLNTIRNRVAHSNAYIGKEGLMLPKDVYRWDITKDINIGKEGFAEDFKKRASVCIKEMTMIIQKFINKGGKFE